MTVTLQDLVNQTNDYLRNYTTSTIDLGNRLRAINRATEFFQRRMGLPSDERVYSFYFVQGTNYYTLPDDLNEPIDLIYHDYTENFPGHEFYFSKYPQVLRLSGVNPSVRYFSTATYNQLKQLLILSNNLNSGSLIESFDDAITEGWFGIGLVSNLTEDTSVKTEGEASLSFTLPIGSGSTHSSGLEIDDTWGPFDFTNYFSLNAWVELDIWMATTNFTFVELDIYDIDFNGFYLQVTENADGTAFTANQWNTVAFPLNQMTAYGSCDIANITGSEILFQNNNLAPVNNMRVDNMRVVIPDYLDLIYYSNFKCTDAAGNDQLNFEDNDDIALFGEYAPDLIGPIAKMAAMELMPQLRQDKEWYAMYKREIAEAVKLWGKTYPRKRVINFGKSLIRRNQTSNNFPNFRIQ